MDRIQVRGGNRLNGEIRISGAKNAALPLMVASLLTDEPLTLASVPHLTDIAQLGEILAGLGVGLAAAFAVARIGSSSISGLLAHVSLVGSCRRLGLASARNAGFGHAG